MLGYYGISKQIKQNLIQKILFYVEGAPDYVSPERLD